MATRQRIVRSRREYNQWVANQTLEDFALRFTAKSARKWSALRVANTALGGISFLALEAIGGTITIGYGFVNATAAILLVGLLIFAAGVPISYYAARDGVDIDLLTRGAGFGYIGSTVTSLIYATFTFIFFAIEAAILAAVLQSCFGIPLGLGYIICSLSIVPLVTHGITFISRVQLWSQPIWLALQVLPFVAIALTAPQAFTQWPEYAGNAPGADGSFHLILFGAAGSVVFALIAQIGEQADYLRFLPQRQPGARNIRWWVALLAGGPGWIFIGILKLLAGSFLACLAVAAGIAPWIAVQPSEMYRVAFGYVTSAPGVALALASVFVVVSQVKINITNAYAGSIAWSNFFARLTHNHPGRVVWLIFNIAIALLLMELGIYQAIEHTLVIYSTIAAAWVGALVADLVVNKPLGFSPPHIEFKRAHLYAINPVGVGAMVFAVALGLTAYAGVLGVLGEAFSPFLGFLGAFVAAPLIAWATDGRYYLARKPRGHWSKFSTLQCVICENDFEPDDMAFCPVYSGSICSLCCSLDARCGDGCKPGARLSSQLVAPIQAALRLAVNDRLSGSLGRFILLLGLFVLVIGVTLAVIYSAASSVVVQDRAALASAFWTVFFILLPVAGVMAWLVALAQGSRIAAEREIRRQTHLLLAEIEAHKRTDAKLQKAKEAAEAANLAKSRYVVGISHELRSPLNAILGYAQLLERDTSISAQRRDGIGIIRRSGEHLAGLIEGLLDISKIEAGRIEIDRDPVRIEEFLGQLVNMFRLQAKAKGIEFTFTRPDRIPAVVYTDERRLRQILINLLSNAMKFTTRGEVHLGLRLRNEIAEFEIEDTGIGIAEADIGRIFEPFERVERTDVPAAPGVGLGLTITKLLTQILGGELTVTSTPGVGSRFRVRLLLAEARGPRFVPNGPERRPLGYQGKRLTVLIADDDPVHRGLMEDLMSPLGFVLFSASTGDGCLTIAAQCRPDLLLLDISMPGLDGWAVAKRLRQMGFDRLKIIVISANAAELRQAQGSIRYHDDFMVKPIGLSDLLTRIGNVMRIEWDAEPPEPYTPTGPPEASPEIQLDHEQLEELRQLLSIGYVRGLHDLLNSIEERDPEKAPRVAHLRQLVANCQLEQFRDALGPEIEAE